MSIPTLLPLENHSINLLFADAELHTHEYWEFTLFNNGVCNNIINGNVYEVSEGFLTILGPAHTHSIESITPTHAHRDIFITDTELRQLCKESFTEDLYTHLCSSQNPVVLQFPLNLVQELERQLTILDIAYIQGQDLEKIKTVAHSVIFYLLGYVFMHENISAPSSFTWLSQQLAFLGQPEVFCLSTTDIVKKTGYSHSQYLRKFKQTTRIPLIKYLINLRINHAKFLLQSTNKSILEISNEVGYDSINYFIRTFKQQTGTTPLQFRIMKRQGK